MSTALAKREIDESYRLRMISDRTDAIARHQDEWMRLQVVSAAANLQELRSISDSVEGIERQFEYLNAGIDELCGTAAQTLDAVEEQTVVLRDQTNVLREGFEALGRQLLSQHKTLIEIGQTLRRPYGTEAAELRDEARKWLTIAMRKGEPEGTDDAADALRLYREVVKNPIGNQDYVVWFDIGWLVWRHEQDQPQAEDAFRRAARLSEPAGDLYHRLAVRYMAHMQYLQGRHEDAWQTIQKIIPDVSDHDSPFDAARYAARTGRMEQAIHFLDGCIERIPSVFTTMFAESDFGPIKRPLLDLASRKLTEARTRANFCIQRGRELAIDMEHWHVAELALAPACGATESLWKASHLLERGTYYALLDAESSANVAIQKAEEANAMARTHLNARFDHSVDEANRARAGVLLRHVSTSELARVEKSLEELRARHGRSSDYDQLVCDIEDVDCIVESLQGISRESHKGYETLRARVKAAGTVFGAIFGALLGAGAGFVVSLPLLLLTGPCTEDMGGPKRTQMMCEVHDIIFRIGLAVGAAWVGILAAKECRKKFSDWFAKRK